MGFSMSQIQYSMASMVTTFSTGHSHQQEDNSDAVPPELREGNNIMAETAKINQSESGAIPTHIGVGEFTETTFAAVLRAIDARQFPHGPIIYGIIYLPSGLGETILSTPE